jgi:predicted RecA/RadA family phage recombinase
MAKTYIQPGDVVTVTAPAGGVKSGDVLVVGNLIGICNIDAVEGAETELSLTGVWELPKATGQINAGAAVFFDNVTGHNVVNASGAGLFPLGVAVKAAGTNDATVRVRLNGVAVAAAGA